MQKHPIGVKLEVAAISVPASTNSELVLTGQVTEKTGRNSQPAVGAKRDSTYPAESWVASNFLDPFSHEIEMTFADDSLEPL
jgi:hypothetical protein